MAIPDTIQGVLMARIDRLPEEHKRLLQTASVLGREFSPRLLEAMWEGTGALPPLLAARQRLEFLYERTGADEPLCVFQHALTQEVAYESLLPTRRQVLHGAAGHALARLSQERLAEGSEALAHHCTLGEGWDKAFVSLARAGDKARQAYANQEAIAFYTRAIDVSGRRHPALDAPQLFPVYEGRGLVWKLLGLMRRLQFSADAPVGTDVRPSAPGRGESLSACWGPSHEAVGRAPPLRGTVCAAGEAPRPPDRRPTHPGAESCRPWASTASAGVCRQRIGT